MNVLDILFILLLTWGGYNGFKKGFVSELVTSSLLVFGLIKGATMFSILLPITRKYFPFLSTAAPICLGIVMFLIGGGIILLLSKMIKAILHVTFLGIFDSLLGAFLGITKLAFFISLLAFLGNYTASTTFLKPYMNNSTLFPVLEPIVPKILQSISTIPVPHHVHIENIQNHGYR
ncbi:CvpA family protein [Cardinium endosymbiont of Culicoides punctatus]|uniref:CvpA family protein n=1 Tax=Cardinium endosymbiont of Culicoides punctatus TaxID=2304601 RepID=UPI001058FAEB|nr:CvpA family protein [Cardinium endosymbiont of Culicoides punctatus]TDG95654.1 hypothetical protein CCPUN_01100 [Cardinium endosymbiont of Culicoides punctatus]